MISVIPDDGQRMRLTWYVNDKHICNRDLEKDASVAIVFLVEVWRMRVLVASLDDVEQDVVGFPEKVVASRHFQ